MSLTNILLALIPAVGWGIQPIFLRKIGGDSTNQVMGFGIGAAIIGAIVHFGFSPESVSWQVFLLAFVSGIFWIFGQAGQVVSYGMIGVSRTMPISTGLQLIGTSIIGVLLFNEWPGMMNKIFGFLAIAMMIIGASLTSVESSHVNSDTPPLYRGILVLLLTSVGYWVYSIAPRLVNADALTIFFPQMLGILTGAVLFTVLRRKEALRERESWMSGFVGLIFGIASLAYIFSAQANGVTIAYILTQLNVVLATLGAVFILHEQKDAKQMRLTYAGLTLIVLASIVTVFL